MPLGIDFLKEVGRSGDGGADRHTDANLQSASRVRLTSTPDVSGHGQDRREEGFVELGEWFETSRRRAVACESLPPRADGLKL